MAHPITQIAARLWNLRDECQIQARIAALMRSAIILALPLARHWSIKA
jgi:hypothetical protein